MDHNFISIIVKLIHAYPFLSEYVTISILSDLNEKELDILLKMLLIKIQINFKTLEQ